MGIQGVVSVTQQMASIFHIRVPGEDVDIHACVEITRQERAGFCYGGEALRKIFDAFLQRSNEIVATSEGRIVLAPTPVEEFLPNHQIKHQ